MNRATKSDRADLFTNFPLERLHSVQGNSPSAEACTSKRSKLRKFSETRQPVKVEAQDCTARTISRTGDGSSIRSLLIVNITDCKPFRPQLAKLRIAIFDRSAHELGQLSFNGCGQFFARQTFAQAAHIEDSR
jgi:hypothetical protein